MLTQAILSKLNSYRARDLVDINYNAMDHQYDIVLNTTKYTEWIEDDGFLRDVIFAGRNMETVLLQLAGNNIELVAVKLESRIVPNLMSYFAHLGYNTNIVVCRPKPVETVYNIPPSTSIEPVATEEPTINKEPIKQTRKGNKK
jgi:hypothetical protein